MCFLNDLRILRISYENIVSIPHCLSNLNQLEVIWIDITLLLTDVPISIFNLPNLIEFSLFNGLVSYQSLIEYNLPEDIWNDTDAVNQWFDDYFEFDIVRTDYWFSLHPLSEEIRTDLPQSLQTFLNRSGSDDFCPISDIEYCPPRLLVWTVLFVLYSFDSYN